MLESQLDGVFRALSDPTRRHILERLAKRPATVSELAEPLAMTLAAVVQHVQVLESSGVVRTEKVGRSRTCFLEPRALTPAERWFADRRALWERRFDAIEELLAEEDEPARAVSPSSKKPKKKKETPS